MPSSAENLKMGFIERLRNKFRYQVEISRLKIERGQEEVKKRVLEVKKILLEVKKILLLPKKILLPVVPGALKVKKI